MSKPEVADLADPERHNFEPYPLTMAVFRIFRAARKYHCEILDKLALGSDTMLDLGNLYTAALPAWMAAGFEQAADEHRELAGEEMLTLGYGSGDAAEVIPLVVADEWREATARICLADSMEFAVDLNEKQYADLHDGRRVSQSRLPAERRIHHRKSRPNQSAPVSGYWDRVLPLRELKLAHAASSLRAQRYGRKRPLSRGGIGRRCDLEIPR